MLNKKDIVGFSNMLSEIQRNKDISYVLALDNSDEVFFLLEHLNFSINGIVLSDNDFPPKRFLKVNAPIYSMTEFLQKKAKRAVLFVIGLKIELAPKNCLFTVGKSQVKVPVIEITKDLMRAVADKRVADEALKIQKSLGIYGIDDFMNHFIHGLYYGNDIEPILYMQPKEAFRHLPKFDFDDVAVVMQGPVHYEDNLTLKTLCWYRKLYPNAPIILSTWKGEVTPEFEEASKAAKIYILENDKPENPGGEHVNFQLYSSICGIKQAEKNPSVRYVLKTRTDQRFYKMDFLAHFKNILKLYPVKGDKLESRLIFSSISYTLWPFFLCDMFVFGHIDDMKKLYSIPFMTNEGDYHYRHKGRFGKICITINRLAVNDLRTLYESKKVRRLMHFMNKFYFPETYAFRTFFDQNIRPVDPENLLKDYWEFLRDYLVIADMRDLMFFWPKYYWCEFKARSFYDAPVYEPTLKHSRWLDLYLNSDDWLM